MIAKQDVIHRADVVGSLWFAVPSEANFCGLRFLQAWKICTWTQYWAFSWSFAQVIWNSKETRKVTMSEKILHIIFFPYNNHHMKGLVVSSNTFDFSLNRSRGSKLWPKEALDKTDYQLTGATHSVNPPCGTSFVSKWKTSGQNLVLHIPRMSGKLTRRFSFLLGHCRQAVNTHILDHTAAFGALPRHCVALPIVARSWFVLSLFLAL